MVLLITPRLGLDKHTYEAAARVEGLKSASYLGKASIGKEGELELLKMLMIKALNTLSSAITEQTVFE